MLGGASAFFLYALSINNLGLGIYFLFILIYKYFDYQDIFDDYNEKLGGEIEQKSAFRKVREKILEITKKIRGLFRKSSG